VKQGKLEKSAEQLGQRRQPWGRSVDTPQPKFDSWLPHEGAEGPIMTGFQGWEVGIRVYLLRPGGAGGVDAEEAGGSGTPMARNS